MSGSDAGNSGSPRRSSRIARGLNKIKDRITGNSQVAIPPVDPPPPQTVYLRINRRFVCRLAAPSSAQPNPPPLPPANNASGNLNVIIADLPDLRPFTGNTVDWLIKVARLIFEPLGTSSLYTFTEGTVETWLDNDSDLTWRMVEDGENLRPVIYEFRPDSQHPVTLTKQSLRHTRSVTTMDSIPQANAFRTTLLQRHGKCVISGDEAQNMLVASHLIPRRLGDSGIISVFQRFAHAGSPAATDRYDPIIGLPLLLNLDGLVNRYELGFWSDGPDKYVVHCFHNAPRNIDGGPLRPHQQALHGHQITLTARDVSLPLPPVAVFDWHYVQCVLKKFSVIAYQDIENIHYFFFPFRTGDDDDSDISFDDDRNIDNPPYPSYLWELSELRERQRLEAVERQQAVAAWLSGV